MQKMRKLYHWNTQGGTTTVGASGQVGPDLKDVKSIQTDRSRKDRGEDGQMLLTVRSH